MTKMNTFALSVYYDIPIHDPNEGLRWETHETLTTLLLPAHIITEEQAQEYLYERSMNWGHEHVRYENFMLCDEVSGSEV